MAEAELTNATPRQITITISCEGWQKELLQAEAARFGWTLTALLLRRAGVEPWPEGVPEEPPTRAWFDPAP